MTLGETQMNANMKAILVGAGIALALTLVVLAPFWVAPGSPFWSRTIGDLPESVWRVIAWIMSPFMFVGWTIVEAIHQHGCARHGCCDPHLAWALEASLVINAVVGGAIGIAVRQAKKKLFPPPSV